MKSKGRVVSGAVSVFTILMAAYVSIGASCGGARHVATVTVVSAHSTLSAIQDSERLLVCGRTTAPQPPQCVPIPIHQQIGGLLYKAFDLDGQVAKLVKDSGGQQTADVGKLVGDITNIITMVLADIPASPQKDAIVKNLGGK